jgi:hypothetical protein
LTHTQNNSQKQAKSFAKGHPQRDANIIMQHRLMLIESLFSVWRLFYSTKQLQKTRKISYTNAIVRVKNCQINNI